MARACGPSAGWLCSSVARGLAALGRLAPGLIAAALSCGRARAPAATDAGARPPSSDTNDARDSDAHRGLGDAALVEAIGAARLRPATPASPEPTDFGDASDPKALCARALHVSPPPADEPSADERQSLAGCDAEALYDGVGAPADDARARACAYAQLAAKSDEVFGGAAILMMIYANGRGVPAQRDIALHFACLVEGAPAELEGRVDHLLRLDRGEDAGAPFDVCDDVTSGFMEGQCRAREERQAKGSRDVRKRAAESGLPPAAVAALDRAARSFFDAREKNEVDLSGTARAAFQIAERARLEDAYVAALERLRDPSFVPKPGELAREDAELNAVFQALVSSDAGSRALLGTVTPAGIRATERAWIPYRDAWVALAAKARPDVRPEVWTAQLTSERNEMLRSLSGK